MSLEFLSSPLPAASFYKKAQIVHLRRSNVKVAVCGHDPNLGHFDSLSDAEEFFKPDSNRCPFCSNFLKQNGFSVDDSRFQGLHAVRCYKDVRHTLPPGVYQCQ